MSVVYDEEPEPKVKREKSISISQRTKGKGKAKGKGKENVDADPNQVEIKRLQGWLIKCGIRKMWSRELGPFSTPRDKIRHLKDMLKDAGMEGRYSQEKAKRIREKRELQADLEVVQEGARLWGRRDADEADKGHREQAARGRDNLAAFLGSEDGEESD